jgi:hypothetical protein
MNAAEQRVLRTFHRLRGEELGRTKVPSLAKGRREELFEEAKAKASETHPLASKVTWERFLYLLYHER